MHQKDCFGNGMQNGVCYDSLTLALKMDRDENLKDYFNQLAVTNKTDQMI